ncbi:MAG: putative replicase [Cressdnaviricota sp.]|nr:MAG: putative replicase [Cressdnaviricota sp.]
MYRSWAVTIRPLNGIQVESKLEDALIRWFKKQDYCFVVSEKEDEARHIHAQIWLNDARDKGTINKSLERIQSANDSDWSPASKLVLRRGTKIAYNDDFVENYLNKCESNILVNSPPLDSSGFYPSKEEQEKVRRKSNAVDQKFHRWSEDFKEWATTHNLISPYSLIDVSRFMGDMFFQSKKYQVIVDHKSRVQNCKCLYHYINSTTSFNMFLSQKDQDEHILNEEYSASV